MTTVIALTGKTGLGKGRLATTIAGQRWGAKEIQFCFLDEQLTPVDVEKTISWVFEFAQTERVGLVFESVNSASDDVIKSIEARLRSTPRENLLAILLCSREVPAALQRFVYDDEVPNVE